MQLPWQHNVITASKTYFPVLSVSRFQNMMAQFLNRQQWACIHTANTAWIWCIVNSVDRACPVWACWCMWEIEKGRYYSHYSLSILTHPRIISNFLIYQQMHRIWNICTTKHTTSTIYRSNPHKNCHLHLVSQEASCLNHKTHSHKQLSLVLHEYCAA